MEALGSSLRSILEKGIKCDSWGQRLEAAKEYQRFLAEYEEGSVNFCASEAAEAEMNGIMSRVGQRARQLRSHQLSVSINDVSLDQIKSDAQAFKELLSQFSKTLNKRHSSVVAEMGEHLLLPRSRSTKREGETYLSIKIDKIGLKDANAYVDPFITVSVKDLMGTDLAPVQHTPPSYHVLGQHLVYELNVHIPQSLEQLSDLSPSFAIFFEQKHYKERDDKISTRCFAFLEPDEIKQGSAVLELYKKPTDFGRKKLYLFTEKPLYLHLNLSLQRE